MSSIAVPLNPFSDQIVTSPRRAEPSVQGLNDHALQKLVGAFTAMELPPRRGGRIQLITSPSGGYGKSHLAGRLYRELGRRATQIYVRPFSDPETHWVSLLHTMIQEMLAPEFTGEEEEEIKDRGTYPPTQLDAFAHGVFASVLIALLDNGEFEYGDPEFVKDRLRNRTFVKWDLGDPQSNWGVWASDMLQRYEESESREGRVLRSLNQATGNHLDATTRPQAWLRVLRRFAANRGATALRDQCLEWMRARTPMIELVTKPLGLLATDGVDSEGGIAARNSMARSRVLDLLTLGRLFRPFVICFDQTEVFGRVPGLARAFGGMLSDLVQCEGAQFTVVTANQEIWNTQLSPSIEVADRDRILPATDLTGLSAAQGRELALNRLRQTRLPVELQELVLAPDWIAYQFGGGLLSPRDFLRRCEQRYEEIVPAALAQPPRPKLMLGELFAQERNKIENDPRESKDFKADALRWALLSVPEKAGADFKATPCRTNVASYTAEWKSKSGAHRYIVLEPSSHTLVWQAIFRKGAALRTEHPGSSVVALRIEGQGAVPQDNQAARVQSNNASANEAFRVYTLNAGELSKVYAGWELYLQACQGDIEYSAEEVLAFVFDRMVPFYTALLGEPVASTLPQPQASSAQGAVTQAHEAPTVIMPRSAIPAPGTQEPRAEASGVQPAVAAPAYVPPSFLGAGSLAGAPSAVPSVAASAGGLKPSAETAPSHKTAIKVTTPADGGMPQSPAFAAGSATFPPPSGLKPVVPISPQPPLMTAPAPSPAVLSAPAPAPALTTGPSAAPPAPAPAAPPPAPAPAAPVAVSPDTDRIVIASVSDILGAPAVRPDAIKAPSPAPSPAPAPQPAQPAPAPAPAQPAVPPPSFAQFLTPPTSGITAPTKPAPPKGSQSAHATSEDPKPGQKAFPSGSTPAPASPKAPSAAASSQQPPADAAPAGTTPPRPNLPSGPGETPRPAGAVPPPNVGAPSKPAAPAPAVAAKPVAPAPAPGGVAGPASRQAPAAAPAGGVPKPAGVPGRPTAPAPGGATAPGPRPSVPGAPAARGPMPAQPGPASKSAPAPTPAPAAPAAEEKSGFFGRLGKMFSKKEAAATPAPAASTTPRRPMPAATAARLAGAVPPGGPPGPKVPGAPGAPAASKRTEPVAVIPVSEDDPPEAAVRPAETPQKKSLTEASPAKDASVEKKASATESPESSQPPQEAEPRAAAVKSAAATVPAAQAEPSAPATLPASVAPAPLPPEAAPASASAPSPAPAEQVPAAPPAVVSTSNSPDISAPAPFAATPASARQHPSQPWSFSNEAMTRLAQLLQPRDSGTNGKSNGNGHGHGKGHGNKNGNGSAHSGSAHSNGKPHVIEHDASSLVDEEPLSQSPSHEAMVWLARCLREYRQECEAPSGIHRVAMFAKEEIPVPLPSIPESVLSEVTSPPSLEKAMLELVKSRRLISYSMLAVELEQRLSRTVTMEETNAVAKASSDIHVYGEGNNAGYLWQGH